eukprot:maker-scaffold248_size238799-snap-gene-1.33 protein:Tk02163 transcript:maker-scaffold248_size238799-snap-gene-1.33-mRNA-1 annotation:"hypothetical protein LOTGIDRAFT_121554"
MLARSSHRLVKAGLALGGATGLYATYRFVNSEEGDFDIYNIGVARFGRAAITVAAIGLDYKKSLFGPTVDHEGPEYQQIKCDCHQRSADRLLKLCCDNGGCFIKVGQHIGALDYLLPEEYVKTMKVLHHKAPEMALKDVLAVLREDLDQEPLELFAEFDEKPLGTASLAQVHRARLKDGAEVAVKVQHRYVRNHSFVDIATMDILVRAVGFVFPDFEFMWLAEEMKKNLPLELSFTEEGKNAEKISVLMDKFSWLKIPAIHWELTTDRILVMEYCPGGHINDAEYIKKHKINPWDISKKLGQMYAEMIFRYGYVHCDPHPGNVLVQKDDSGHDQIVLLDHGLYTQLTHDFRGNYANFWLSILNADTEGIKVYADKLGVGQLYGLFACMVSGRSWSSIQKGIGKNEKSSAESKEIKDNAQMYIKQIADVLAFVNRQMILLFKTNDLLRGIEYSLGTQNSMASFIQMSRACFRCLSADERRFCRTRWCRFQISVSSQWQQVKISFYQVFLWFWWSNLGRGLRSLNNA